MKLSTYAKKLGVCYRTAWNWFNEGKIDGAYQLPSEYQLLCLMMLRMNMEWYCMQRTSSSQK